MALCHCPSPRSVSEGLHGGRGTGNRGTWTYEYPDQFSLLSHLCSIQGLQLSKLQTRAKQEPQRLQTEELGMSLALNASTQEAEEGGSLGL